MDFAIVSKERLDLNADRIIDYRNASCLYYVDFSDDKGNLRLNANLNHIKLKSTMPRTSGLPV